MWNPAQYQRFSAERGRPFLELLARVQHPEARIVVDLGCGTGELTALLPERFPRATVRGMDSSPEMLAEAASRADGRLSFERGDIATWEPGERLDVLLSNAAFHWVPGHLELFPRFAGWLAPGGIFAFGVPGNFDAPSHVLLREVCRRPAWAERLGGRVDRGASVERPETYLSRLAALGLAVDAWETTYFHVLPGEDAVLEWVKGTALRPILSALPPEEHAAFLAEYGALLRKAYPRGGAGTVFPFRRIFVVARAD